MSLQSQWLNLKESLIADGLKGTALETARKLYYMGAMETLQQLTAIHSATTNKDIQQTMATDLAKHVMEQLK